MKIENMAATQNTVSTQKQQAEEEKQQAFLQMLRDFDALQETDDARRRRLAAEAEAARQKREKDAKMQELFGLIAQLRAKLAAAGTGGGDAIAAELSAAQTQLMWLMMGG